MMKEEFEALLQKDNKSTCRKTTTGDEYEIVQTVYAWHPRNFSKEQMAAFWITQGLGFIEDLLPASLQARFLEEQIRISNAEVSAMQRKRDEELQSLHEAWDEELQSLHKAWDAKINEAAHTSQSLMIDAAALQKKYAR